MALPLLRAMTVDDLDAAMLIERVSFQQPWSRHMYWMDLNQNELATYVMIEPAESDRELMPPVLAYGGFWLIFDEAHIATIASHPDWRRCGLGAFVLLGLLSRAVERGAQRATLEVRPSNTGARHLYDRMGFETVGLRRRYYQDGEDALIMSTNSLTGADMVARIRAEQAATATRLTSCFCQ